MAHASEISLAVDVSPLANAKKDLGEFIKAGKAVEKAIGELATSAEKDVQRVVDAIAKAKQAAAAAGSGSTGGTGSSSSGTGPSPGLPSPGGHGGTGVSGGNNADVLASLAVLKTSLSSIDTHTGVTSINTSLLVTTNLSLGAIKTILKDIETKTVPGGSTTSPTDVLTSLAGLQLTLKSIDTHTGITSLNSANLLTTNALLSDLKIVLHSIETKTVPGSGGGGGGGGSGGGQSLASITDNAIRQSKKADDAAKKAAIASLDASNSALLANIKAADKLVAEAAAKHANDMSVLAARAALDANNAAVHAIAVGASSAAAATKKAAADAAKLASENAKKSIIDANEAAKAARNAAAVNQREFDKQQRIADQQAKRDAERAQYGGNTLRQNNAALRGVPAQFTDIFTSLQGGQNPLTVMLQQGGQLKDMFGGSVSGAIKAMGGYLLTLITPVNTLAAAVGVLSYAYASGANEASEFKKALVLSGNQVGTTAIELGKMASSIKGLSTLTQHDAAEGLAAIAQTGAVAAENLEYFTAASLEYSKNSGVAIDVLIDKFKALAKDPVGASEELNASMNYLTPSIYKQIKALELQGKHLQAVKLAQTSYADSLMSKKDKMVDNLQNIEFAWRSLTDWVFKYGDGLRDVGRAEADVFAGRLLASMGMPTIQPEDKIAKGVMDNSNAESDRLNKLKMDKTVDFEKYATKAKLPSQILMEERAAFLEKHKLESIVSIAPTATKQKEIPLASLTPDDVANALTGGKSAQKLTPESIANALMANGGVTIEGISNAINAVGNDTPKPSQLDAFKPAPIGLGGGNNPMPMPELAASKGGKNPMPMPANVSKQPTPLANFSPISKPVVSAGVNESPLTEYDKKYNNIIKDYDKKIKRALESEAIALPPVDFSELTDSLEKAKTGFSDYENRTKALRANAYISEEEYVSKMAGARNKLIESTTDVYDKELAILNARKGNTGKESEELTLSSKINDTLRAKAKALEDINRAASTENSGISMMHSNFMRDLEDEKSLIGKSTIEVYKFGLEKKQSFTSAEITLAVDTKQLTYASKIMEQLNDDLATFDMNSGEKLAYRMQKEGAKPEDVEAAKGKQDGLDAKAATEAVKSPMDQYKKTLEDIIRLQKAGLSDTSAIEMQKRAWDEMASSIDRGKLSMEGVDGFSKVLGMEIRDNLGSMTASFVSGKFDEIEKTFASMMENMLSKAIESNLQQAITGLSGGGGGGGFMGALGTVFSSIFGARADGGSVRPNGMYEVNERGPEVADIGGRQYLMTGSAGGHVKSNSQSQGALGGGQSVSIVINNNGTNTKATATESTGPGGMRQFKIMVEDIVNKSIASGGGIDKMIKGTYGVSRGASLNA